MIFVLHGKNSSAETSDTVRRIKEYFRDRELVFFGKQKVFAPSYDSDASHADIEKRLSAFVEEKLSMDAGRSVFTVVGNSLGGYWARFLANRYKADNLIMINPSLDYYGIAASTPSDSGCMGICVYLGMQDEVVDPSYAYNLYSKRALVECFPEGGHRLTDEEKTIVLNGIEKCIDTIHD